MGSEEGVATVARIIELPPVRLARSGTADLDARETLGDHQLDVCVPIVVRREG